MRNITIGVGGQALAIRCENLVEEFAQVFGDWQQCCRPQKVSRPYFEGQLGQSGFLWDFFTCIRSMGMGHALDSLQPKLDTGGHLPYKSFFSKWARCPTHTLEKLANLHEMLNKKLMAKERVPEELQPIHHYFINHGGKSSQKAEAGRFILLVSEGCAHLAKMKKVFLNKGFKFLDDLNLETQPELKKGNAHHPLHELVQECYAILQKRLKQHDLAFDEYQLFMKQLLEDRKKHLASVMVLLNNSSNESISYIQGIQLHLQLQLHWSGMDGREEVKGLKSNQEFRRHLETFQNNLFNQLKGLEIIQLRLNEELNKRVALNFGMMSLFESIKTLMDSCSRMRETIPRELNEKLARNQKYIVRILNRLKTHLKENSQYMKEWPPLALARYRYFEMEILSVLLRSNDTEIKSMGRSIPYLHNAIQKDLEEKLIELEDSLKQRLEDLVLSTARILKKESQA